MTIAELAGRVILRRGLGDEPGLLEVVVRQGKRHAYVNTDAGKRVHLPFAPDTDRGDFDYQRHLVLGTKVDHSSGDTIVTVWSLRAGRP